MANYQDYDNQIEHLMIPPQDGTPIKNNDLIPTKQLSFGSKNDQQQVDLDQFKSFVMNENEKDNFKSFVMNENDMDNFKSFNYNLG